VIVNKVYYWAPCVSDSNVGHSSLDVSFGQGLGLAEYVSWWPGAYSLLISGPGATSDFPSDVAAEGRIPDSAVELYCLDEDRMRSAWLQVVNSGGYSFYNFNCAACVASVLASGGATLANEVSSYYGSVGLWTPDQVLGMAWLIDRNSSIITQQRANGWQQQPQGWLDLLFGNYQ
jgi:hypothetical protein